MKNSVEKLQERVELGEKIECVFFYEPREKDGKITKACFCQWYPCHFVVDGIRYNCAEQYMMAEKARFFGDEETRRRILRETNPGRIKHLGREVRPFDPGAWDAVSYEVVVKGNLHKFGQNPALMEVLLGTGDRVIAEASPRDTLWGIGMDEAEAKHVFPHVSRGKNRLGFALMDVREELKDTKSK